MSDVRPCNTEDFGRAADALEGAGFEDLSREMNLSLDALFERHEVALSLLAPAALRRDDVAAFPERKKATRRKRAAPVFVDDLFS